MVVAVAWRIGGWIDGLTQWLAPSTILAGTTTTGSRNNVPDARETPDAPTPAAEQASSRPQLAVQPEATTGTSEPLREATRRSLVPAWLARLRTQVFTGLSAMGLAAFIGLTGLVTTGLTAPLDLAVTQTVQAVALPWFGPLMLAVSALGFPPQNFLIVLAVFALLWIAGYRTEAGFAGAAAGSVVLTETFKRLIGRPRPGADLVAVIEGATGHSFPSGHVLFYVTFLGFVAYLAYAHLKPGRNRTIVLWLTGMLILLIGPSRIWMGQHWVSDVLASYALGLTYLIILVQVYGRRRLRRGRHPVEAVTTPG